jgi:hypothetical protein
VIFESYTKGSVKNDKKEVFLVAHIAMKSLYVGTGHYLYKIYNCHDSRACGYMWSAILTRIDGLGMVMAWYWIQIIFGVAV